MKVAITGSSGLIGSALMANYVSSGHHVVRVVRSHPGPNDVLWNPEVGTIDAGKLIGVDAVVHLAGAGIGDHRWSPSYKERVLSSRVKGTRTIATALAQLPVPPSVMVSGSAVGFYGSRGDEVLSEDSRQGSGFLADVCVEWESATQAATTAGIRVAMIRTGVVLSAAGGAFKKQLPLFKLGLGARLGDGSQQFSWITRRDAVSAIQFLVENQSMSGPINLTSPQPVSNREFTKALGSALRRPTPFAVPRSVLSVALGQEMASELLMASQRVVPARLSAAGFTFSDAMLNEALTTALNDRSIATLN